jgi:hypothetical protein
MSEKLYDDGKPVSYKGTDGNEWFMQACGHRMSGGFSANGLCPNCLFLAAHLHKSIEVKYPELLPENLKENLKKNTILKGTKMS